MLRHFNLGRLLPTLPALLSLSSVACAPSAPAAAPASPSPPAAPTAGPKASGIAPAEPETDIFDDPAEAREGNGEKPASPEKLQEAEADFKRGVSLLEQGAVDAALGAFVLSADHVPTPNATLNAAICLQRLRRFDEALAMYEKLLRDFPALPEGTKTSVQRAVADLYEVVGTLEITGCEPGATILVGGQERGEYPPAAPLRVTAGTHMVRVLKDGFEPFEDHVEVVGGHTKSLSVKLRPSAASGRLKVVEQSGRSVDVLVDGVAVGKTPWEGVQTIGVHIVSLRGPDTLGTQPVAAPVKLKELTALSLRAEPLESFLRIEPSPPGAAVSIDSVHVGRGAWAGRLRAGAHRIEISGEGFVSQSSELRLVPGDRQIHSPQLERDESAEVWRKPPKVLFDFGASAALAPSFMGEPSDACKKDCSRGIGLGVLARVHGTYQLGSGLGFGVSAGYLHAVQDLREREGELIPAVEQPARRGTLNETIRIQGALAGVSVSYRFGDTVPVLLRLGGGALVGSARSDRYGRFPERDADATGQIREISTAPAATASLMAYAYVEPELRLGFRFAERFEAGLNLGALVLIALSQPKWDSSIELDAGSHGIGTYPGEALVGPFLVFLTPGASLRYEF